MTHLLEEGKDFRQSNTIGARCCGCRQAMIVLLLAGLLHVSGVIVASEDVNLGVIVDQQGNVVLRPAHQRRWTPVVRRTLLLPSDWPRTDMHGADAVRLKLLDGSQVTLGPVSPNQFKAPDT
jgi:hypothetical protein